MALLNAAQKRKARDFCRERDGDKCTLAIKCNGISGAEYRKLTGRDFDLHHKNGNPHDNPPDGSNWQDACHPCNVAAGPFRGRTARPKFASHLDLKEIRSSVSECVSVSEREQKHGGDRENVQIRYREVEIKERVWRAFERAVFSILRKHGPSPRREVILGACKDVEKKAKRWGIKPISQVTGGRYLDILAAELAETAELKYYEGKPDKEGNKVVMVWFRQNGESSGGQTGEELQGPSTEPSSEGQQ